MSAKADPDTKTWELGLTQAAARGQLRVVAESWNRSAKIHNERTDARRWILGPSSASYQHAHDQK
jgi:hypothetical protein